MAIYTMPKARLIQAQKPQERGTYTVKSFVFEEERSGDYRDTLSVDLWGEDNFHKFDHLREGHLYSLDFTVKSRQGKDGRWWTSANLHKATPLEGAQLPKELGGGAESEKARLVSDVSAALDSSEEGLPF
jgi:hypothetical protein